jgi:hypothetical protein
VLNKFSYTAVLAHFGDMFWVKQAIIQGNLVHEKSIEKIIIIDQNRGDTGLEDFASNIKKIEVIKFPINGSGNADHANSLNSVFRQFTFSTTHVLIMDSDLLVQENQWLITLGEILSHKDACLALDPISDYLTHPCFMVIPSTVCKSLDFKEGMSSLRVDTGRTIGIQLNNLGVSIELLRPKKSYGGKLGFSYLNSSLYHVTSVSIRQQPSRLEGKSALWITMAEAWRRWVVNSNLNKSDTKFSAHAFGTVRILFCFIFFFKFIYNRHR